MSDSSYQHKCPGLPADWINAWLAAVGTTVLVPGLRLAWTTDALPIAVLEHSNEKPTDILAKSWPTNERLRDMPLADTDLYNRYINGKRKEPPQRKVLVDNFIKAVNRARKHQDAWTLTSSMTDLAVQKTGEVENGLFDPAAPGSTKWLHHRLMRVYEKVDPDKQIETSLSGNACLAIVNGLGFDIARLGMEEKIVDPVIETLAFFGLALLPVRGDGVRTKNPRSRQRGWEIGGRREFVWPAWSQPLDQAGIDALLDAWHNSWRLKQTNKVEKREWKTNDNTWKLLGVHAAWHTTRYVTSARADPTRGYGSRRFNP